MVPDAINEQEVALTVAKVCSPRIAEQQDSRSALGRAITLARCVELERRPSGLSSYKEPAVLDSVSLEVDGCAQNGQIRMNCVGRRV